MTIKNLVFSGGGPIIIQILAAVQHLESIHFFDLKNIETIYGTSSGAIIGILICLKFDWITLNDYIIKRPWHDVFLIKIQNIFDAYTKKGIFDIKTIEKCFKPLFDAKDISIDINLEDFFYLSNIELHLFTFEINEYKITDISYKTHPKLKLLTAIHMTCGIPLLITPVCIDNKCYIDGGIICNYPLNNCIESKKNIDEILGFKSSYTDDKTIINSESTMLDFLLNFLFKAIFSNSTDFKQETIKYEVICNANFLNINYLRSAISNIDIRKELFINGTESAINFMSKLENISNLENSV